MITPSRLTKDLLGLALFLVSFPLKAQDREAIRGVIKDQDTGRSIPSALITIQELANVRVQANNAGEFSIRGLPNGTYHVTASRIGYERKTEVVQVSTQGAGPAVVNFLLTSNGSDYAAIAAVSAPRSAWVGAEVGYNLGGVGDATENFLASGNAVLEVLGTKTPHFGTYVVGNLSRLSAVSTKEAGAEKNQLQLRKLQQSAQGVQVSVVPHLFYGDSTDESLTGWLSFGWKVNALKTPTDDTKYLNQMRIGLGTQVTGLRGEYSGLPVSLGLEVWKTAFSADTYEDVFGNRESGLVGFDASLILPVGAGRGILIEANFAREVKPVVRVGLLLASGNPNVAGR